MDIGCSHKELITPLTFVIFPCPAHACEVHESHCEQIAVILTNIT